MAVTVQPLWHGVWALPALHAGVRGDKEAALLAVPRPCCFKRGRDAMHALLPAEQIQVSLLFLLGLGRLAVLSIAGLFWFAPSMVAGEHRSSQPPVVVETGIRQGHAISLGFLVKPSPTGMPLYPLFDETVRKDLESAGTFRLLPPETRFSVDPPAFDAWASAGADLLLFSHLQRSEKREITVQVHLFDARARKRLFVKNYVSSEQLLRRMAHRIVDDLLEQLTGQRGVSESRIVFTREISRGIKELFQLERDGTGLRPLTRYGSLTISPSLAPDGRLAFVSYVAGAPEIWGQRKPGAEAEKLYPLTPNQEGYCSSPAWDPEGQRLAFVQGDRRGNSDIVILEMATNRLRRLTAASGINTEPSWNPSGTQLAFTSDREGSPQVYVMEADGSNVRRLTTEGNYNASPSWSPNGAMIAYVSRFENRFDLFLYKLSEGKAYQLTRGLANSESPSWSPDSQRLVFTSGGEAQGQIQIVDLQGRILQTLETGGPSQSPRWSRSK